MKGIVVEINGKTAVVLDSVGMFKKIPDNGYCLGHEVDIPEKRSMNISFIAKVASIAAVFILAAGLGIGAYSYTRPYSYIDVDINPSIEITTNVFNRIISIKALNEDGEKILASGSYKHKTLNEGVKSILNSAVENGYLKSTTDNAVMFTVSSKDDDRAASLEESLKNTTEDKLGDQNIATEVILQEVDSDKRSEAEKLGISPGKLVLIQKLQALNPEVKVEDYKSAPVRQIMKEIKDNKSQRKANKNDKSKENKDKNEKDVNNTDVNKNKEDKDSGEQGGRVNEPNNNDNSTEKSSNKEKNRTDKGKNKKEDGTEKNENNVNRNNGPNDKNGNGNNKPNDRSKDDKDKKNNKDDKDKKDKNNKTNKNSKDNTDNKDKKR